MTILIMSIVAPLGAQAGQGDDQREMFYVIVAHPDDEFAAWSMVSAHPDDYVVFVTLTKGEGTVFCLPPEQSRDVAKGPAVGTIDGEDTTMIEGFESQHRRTGPYGYQGPESPVGEPNRNERHPLGDPWVGMRTEECKRARIASWHWFLDDMHTDVDGTGTTMDVSGDPWVDDDYKGPFCPPGANGLGGGRPIEKKVGCADVWANDEGARIAFDLGNGHPDWHYDPAKGKWIDPNLKEFDLPEAAYDQDLVAAAVRTLRAERASWGLPVLPEAGMVAAVDGPDQSCFADTHPDHREVREALRFTDFDAGPQYGIARCPHDPLLQGAETASFPAEPAATLLGNLINPVTEEAIGPLQVNYGWVYPTYLFSRSSDFYWKVFD